MAALNISTTLPRGASLLEHLTAAGAKNPDNAAQKLEDEELETLDDLLFMEPDTLVDRLCTKFGMKEGSASKVKAYLEQYREGGSSRQSSDRGSSSGSGGGMSSGASGGSGGSGGLYASPGDLESLLPSGIRTIDSSTVTIGSFIARGGFASVYEGEWIQTIMGRRCEPRAIAAKKFDAIAALSPRDRGDLIKELSVMAELPHPNLVQLLGVLQDGPAVYIVMDLMHSDLDKILHGATGDKKKEGASASADGASPPSSGRLLAADTVLRIVRDISEGMAHLEAHKMTHLDLKGQNVFSANPQLTHFQIGDFGLSKQMNATLTRFSSSPGGTLCYMAPEIICEQPYGLPADAYSASVLFVEVITGQRPWHDVNPRLVASKIEQGKRLSVPPVSERCPAFLADVIDRSFAALPSNPTTRPKFHEMVRLVDEYEASTAREEHRKLEKLREKLLEAKANDARTYGAAWQKLSNDDSAAAEGVLRAVQELKASVGGGGGGGGGEAPRQSDDITSIAQLRTAADAAGAKLHAFGEKIARECGGGVVYKGAPTKGAPRIAEKVRTDYGGDVRRIVDAARGSIVCETLAQLRRVVGVLQAGGAGVPKVVRVKDRLSAPASGGYRDVMLNVEEDGHVCELQLHLSTLIAIKSQAHRIYDILRAVGWEGHESPQKAGERRRASGSGGGAKAAASDPPPKPPPPKSVAAAPKAPPAPAAAAAKAKAAAAAPTKKKELSAEEQKQQNKALFDAAKKGEMGKFKAAIAAGAEVDWHNPDRVSELSELE
jgi:serine/threonine protein kinase